MIIGRGTKRKGLYYVDDVASGHVHQVQRHNGNNHKKIWLWHRRLGHASFGYIKSYFLPSLMTFWIQVLLLSVMFASWPRAIELHIL